MDEINVTITEPELLIIVVREVEKINQAEPKVDCLTFNVPDLLQIYQIAKS